MTYGERLRGWRKFRGLTCIGLADKVGVSRQTVLAWERDTWKPSEQSQAQLALALGFQAPPKPVAPKLPVPPRVRARAS